MNRTLLWPVGLVLAAGMAGCGSDKKTKETPDKNEDPFAAVALREMSSTLREAIAAEDTGDVKLAVLGASAGGYWQAVQTAALAVGADLGITIKYGGPADLVGITDPGTGFDALSAQGSENHWAFMQSAIDAGMNVATFDTDPLGDVDRVMHFSSSLQGIGEAAGEQLIKFVEPGAKVAALVWSTTAAASTERVVGYKRVVEASGMQFVAEYMFQDTVGGDHAALAQTFFEDNPGVTGVFIPWGFSTGYVLDAIATLGIGDSVKVVVVDSSEEVLTGLATGTVHAVLGQRGYWSSYLSCAAAVAAHLFGEAQARSIVGELADSSYVVDTGFDVVTAENLQEFRNTLSDLNLTDSQ